MTNYMEELDDTTLDGLVVPAATLVIFRRGVPPELLMVVRSQAMRFAGGAAVFPGGRVEPGDVALAADLVAEGQKREEIAARIAAIRETLEETGLLVGICGSSAHAITAESAQNARSQLLEGRDLAAIMAANGWQFDLDALIPFARWRPKHREARVFDTRFYLADLGTGAVDVAVDATENHQLFWASAAETLRLASEGSLSIIFPTARNLERLAQFDSYEKAREHAQQTPVKMISPWLETRDGEPHLCIPDDAGYPITSELLSQISRG